MRIGAVGLHLNLYSTLTSYGTDRGLNYFGRMIRQMLSGACIHAAVSI